MAQQASAITHTHTHIHIDVVASCVMVLAIDIGGKLTRNVRNTSRYNDPWVLTMP